jgi:N-acylglucosamine-6-phosphate 2-epimerase
MVERKKYESISRLEGGLIASCQASSGEPLCAPEHILALALSAVAGGAIGLRLEGVENIKVVKNSKLLPDSYPVVGLIKSNLVASDDRLRCAYITSTFNEAIEISEAGADIVALDATGRERSDGSSVHEMIRRVHEELGKPVWADIATFGEGITACDAGADIVSTTLYGYTEETASPFAEGPALDLLKDLADHLDIPVILEGRVWHPEEVTQAFENGAFAVVVGSAITRPTLITERFVKAIPIKRKRTLF